MPNVIPQAYKHLNTAQYALQKQLNSLKVIIKHKGEQLKGDNCPLTPEQLKGLESAYLHYNRADERTSYIITFKHDTRGRVIGTINTFEHGQPLSKEVML